jgi:hypothetical protein
MRLHARVAIMRCRCVRVYMLAQPQRLSAGRSSVSAGAASRLHRTRGLKGPRQLVVVRRYQLPRASTRAGNLIGAVWAAPSVPISRRGPVALRCTCGATAGVAVATPLLLNSSVWVLGRSPTVLPGGVIWMCRFARGSVASRSAVQHS